MLAEMEGYTLFNKESQLLSRKHRFTTNGRSSDLLLLSGRLPERLGFQWHSGQREELTAAGTVRDLHPIPY